jgi:hypothetical protein
MEQFEHYLREQFEDFESETSPESWERIREQLHPKKRRIVAFWWLPTGIAALVLFGIWFASNPKKTAVATTENKSQTTLNQSIIENKETKSNILSSITKSEKTNTITKNTTTTPNQKSKTDAFQTQVKANKNSNSTAQNNTQNTIIANANSSNANNEISSTTINATTKKSVEEVVTKIAILFPNALDIATRDDLEIPKIDISPILKTPVQSQKQKTKFYTSVGLSSNYRNITPISGDEFYLNNITAPNAIALNRLGWDASAGVQIPFLKHWAIRPALAYQGYLTQLNYDLSQPKVEDITGTASLTGTTFTIKDYPQNIITEKNAYHSLNLQADIMYFFNKKNALSVGGGVGRTLGTNPQSGTYVSAAYQRRIKGINIEPFFQYHLSNYRATSTYYNFQPYRVGVRANL